MIYFFKNKTQLKLTNFSKKKQITKIWYNLLLIVKWTKFNKFLLIKSIFFDFRKNNWIFNLHVYLLSIFHQLNLSFLIRCFSIPKQFKLKNKKLYLFKHNFLFYLQRWRFFLFLLNYFLYFRYEHGKKYQMLNFFLDYLLVKLNIFFIFKIQLYKHCFLNKKSL